MTKINKFKKFNTIYTEYNTSLRKAFSSINKKFLYTASLLIEENIKNNYQIFVGDYLKRNSDIHIHVKVNDYGISEDIFQSIMHIFVKIICSRNNK